MQLKLHMVTIEDLVPEEHFLRKSEMAPDLSCIYLGLDLLDRVTDHSTISQLRRRKTSFRKVLQRLDAHEEEGLEEPDRRTQAGKAGRKRRQKGQRRQVRSPLRYDRKWASRTDPESGHLNPPGKPRGPHYLTHQTVDCDLPLFHRVLRDLGIRLYVRPLPRSAAALSGVPGSPFLYDEEKYLYTYPGGKPLRLRNLKRSVGGLHWVYYADRSDCAARPMSAQCVGKGRTKRLERNYFWRESREDLSKLDSPMYQRALRKRQVWSEGTFAAQKWGRNLARLLRRGSETAEDRCLLSATA